MNRYCRKRALGIFILSVLVVTTVFPINVSAQNTAGTVTKRDVTINVRVVFVGIDPSSVSLDYLNWNNPQKRYQLTVYPGIGTDTTYSIKYDVSFASQPFLQRFSSYLDSIKKVETRTNVLWNESYFTIQGSYFLNYTHYPVNATNTYYSADAVETWLLDNAQDYGGTASSGYTLMIADLSSELPSTTPEQFASLGTKHSAILTPHFYNKTFTDHDLGIQLNRRFMTAWGGHQRFFFIDLSAGPGSAAEQLPIQLAAYANRVGPSSPYWRDWLTQYLGDFITGAIYNVFVPDFVYPLNYAQRYRVQVFVIDNRTKDQPPIEKTVDATEIKTQLGALLPFAEVQVEVKFSRLTDRNDLLQTVKSATSPSLAGVYPIVDARPVYDWLSQSDKGHIADFTSVTRNSGTFDIPVFVFAFDRNYTFGFTYKELVSKEIDFDRTIWGVALYDLVLISHSADDLTRGGSATPAQPGLGFGFTNTVIHEVGHMVGLMHPFATLYDPTENFVSSVMAYYPYENSFSQFDKDALLRGYADQSIRNTVQVLETTNFDFLNGPDMNSASSELAEAQKAYDQLNYAEAVKHANAAYTSASRAQLLGGGQITSRGATVMVGVFSFLLGAVIIAVISRRRNRTSTIRIPAGKNNCSNCGRALTWIPQYERWYCYKCRKYD